MASADKRQGRGIIKRSALLIVGVILALAGCAAQGPLMVGVTDRSIADGEQRLQVKTMDYESFMVISYGSSECPIYPESIAVIDSKTLKVDLANTFDPEKCADDLVATEATYLFPEGVTRRGEIEVYIGGQAFKLGRD